MSVRPSVRAQKLTKTQERIKIIECFLFESCILGIETADSNARRLTKLELNEIFNDFVISRSGDRTKISEIEAE